MVLNLVFCILLIINGCIGTHHVFFSKKEMSFFEKYFNWFVFCFMSLTGIAVLFHNFM